MKSYVSAPTYACPVCGNTHSTGEVLLHKKLRNVLEERPCVGWELCEEHQKQRDEGYAFLVGVDEGKSDQSVLGEMNLAGVWRTGSLVAVKAEMWGSIFDIPLPDKGIAFCPEEVIAQLEQIQQECEDHT